MERSSELVVQKRLRPPHDVYYPSPFWAPVARPLPNSEADLWGVAGQMVESTSPKCRRSARSMGSLSALFYNDHPPPHFHARYGEFEATVDIGTLEVIEGQLPRRALNLVREWAMMHREELLEDWRFCRENTAPAKIEPLA